MKPDYKNWLPQGMINAFVAVTCLFGAAAAFTSVKELKFLGSAGKYVSPVLFIITGVLFIVDLWGIYMNRQFSYDGKRKLAKQIIEGTAEYVNLEKGQKCLDVGCGSGALTIAVAKRNPEADIIGIDRWGKEYASFSKKLCEDNARAENVDNVWFAHGDAVKLDFEDESFDAVTSNFVYHNVYTKSRQELLRETFRVLKKGGTFAIHDIMSRSKYGDMDKFVESLLEEGYEKAELIDTDDGLFMTKGEARIMMLTGSKLLVGKK